MLRGGVGISWVARRCHSFDRVIHAGERVDLLITSSTRLPIRRCQGCQAFLVRIRLDVPLLVCIVYAQRELSHYGCRVLAAVADVSQVTGEHETDYVSPVEPRPLNSS